MTTPAQALAPVPGPAATQAGPAPDAAAAALFRALSVLASAIDGRVAGDVGAAINVAACHGADPADLEVIEAYAVAELGLR